MGRSSGQRRRPVARTSSAVCRTRKSQARLSRTANPKEEMTCPKKKRLTVKLSGRGQAHPARRGRTLSPGARGAKPATPHGPLERLLGGNLLERELWSASANRGVFNRDRADIALGVEVEHGVLVQIARLGYRSVPELNQQRVRVFEVPNLHGTKSLSKNAL